MIRRMLVIAVVALAASLNDPALACKDHAPGKEPKKSAAAHESAWIAGEVRDVDVTDRTITLGHDRIPSLGMEPMTSMMFKAKNAAILAAAKPGQKVRFRVRPEGDQSVVTRLVVVK